LEAYRLLFLCDLGDPMMKTSFKIILFAAVLSTAGVANAANPCGTSSPGIWETLIDAWMAGNGWGYMPIPTEC
jgi:hypothetical protein